MKTTFFNAAALVLATCLSAINPGPVHAAGEGSINLDGVENAKHAAVAILNNTVDIKNYNYPGQLPFNIRASAVHLHDGYILTARHASTQMLGGTKGFAREISIVTENLEEHTATLVGGNNFIDIAVYKLDPSKLVTPLSDTKFSAQEPRSGEDVYTIGYPLGWGPTHAYGKAGNTRTFLPTADYRMMQLDMASCSGNSGGALFNADGEIAGFVQSIIPTLENEKEQQCSRMTFAMPGTIIARVADAIIAGGNVKFPVMGISMEVTTRLAGAWRVSVKEVHANGPAEQAGMKKDDIILSIGDVPVTGQAQLKNHLIENVRPGDRKDVKIMRQGKEKTLTITLGGAS